VFGGVTASIKASEAALDAQSKYTEALAKSMKSKAKAAGSLSVTRRTERRLTRSASELKTAEKFLREAEGSVALAKVAHAKAEKKFYEEKHKANEMGLDDSKAFSKAQHWMKFTQAILNGATAKKKDAQGEVKQAHDSIGKWSIELRKAESDYKKASRIANNDDLEAQSKHTSQTFAIENRDAAQDAESAAQKARLLDVYKDARLAADESVHAGIVLGPLQTKLESVKIQLQEETAAGKKATRQRVAISAELHRVMRKLELATTLKAHTALKAQVGIISTKLEKARNHVDKP